MPRQRNVLFCFLGAGLGHEGVDEDHHQQHDTTDHGVDVASQTEEAQALIHDVQQQDADHGAVDTTTAAGQRSTANDGGSDTGQSRSC